MSSKRSKSHYDGKIAGLYDLEDTIGRGHFAVVKLARHVFTGEKVAVKVIDKAKLDEVSRAHLFQEVRCMKLVQHPNVVRLYEVIDTQTKLYLILELGDGGDMYDYIMKHDKGLDEQQAQRYFHQIVQAIHYCHKLHVVHRDLKPENVVFFEKPGIVKLTDFGFSNKFVPGRKLETSCGSLAYSAPEILLGDSYDAPAVDVWSLGVILYMLVCGEPPFQEANDSETLTMIMDCKYRMPAHLSNEVKNLISVMLVREPRERAQLDAIMKHAWLQAVKNVPEAPCAPDMPLISRENLPPEDHEYVLQKMVDGKIATMEEIIQSLEEDCYNHITATYYLLAERRLRRHHEQNASISMTTTSATGWHDKQQDGVADSKSHKTPLAPLALSPRAQSADTGLNQLNQARQQHQNLVESLVSPPGVHPTSATSAGAPSARAIPHSPSFPGRRISLIQEECIEEDEEEMQVDEAEIKAITAKCGEGSDESASGSPAQGSPSRQHRRSAGVRPLHTVRSSPQLLNQIFEEGESEDDDGTNNRKNRSPSTNIHRKSVVASPEVIRKYEQRKKRMTSSSRGTSCSSSDASDTDETDSRKRKEKLKQKFHRRDSSDQSSDNDGPGSGPPGPSQGSRGTINNSASGKDWDRGKDNKDRGNNDKDNRDNKGNNKNGANNENKHNLKTVKERRHSIGSPRVKSKTTSITEKDSDEGSENLPQLDLGRRISTLSVGSNLSNISLASINSRSSKYLVESSAPNTPSPRSHSRTDSTVDALNEENRARTRVIHVRSKEFSDLRDRFTNAHKSDPNLGCREPHAKLRRRSKDRSNNSIPKTDINRNGLIARADGSFSELNAKDHQQQQLQQNSADGPTPNNVVQSGVVTTKCCSLV